MVIKEGNYTIESYDKGGPSVVGGLAWMVRVSRPTVRPNAKQAVRNVVLGYFGSLEQALKAMADDMVAAKQDTQDFRGALVEQRKVLQEMCRKAVQAYSTA